MRNQPTAWLCVFCLASVASVLAPDIARAQAAAEYRTHTEAAKSWPRDAVRGAKAMVATDAELGSNAGVEVALKTYGTMKMDEVMGPAIRLAQNGFVASDKLARQLQEEKAGLERFPVSRRIFLNDGKMLKAGDTLKQPELAATLKRIAKSGAEEFYRGETARMLVADMANSGGLITLEDLAAYKPRVREVLRAKYESGGHEWEVVTSPPPSSGGVAIIEALNILRDVPLKNWDDVESVHMVAEAMRRVFADRAAYLADPDFAKVPLAGPTDPFYAHELAGTIAAQRASSRNEWRPGKTHACGATAAAAAQEKLVSLEDGPHTPHFSVVAEAGYAGAG